MRYCGHVKSASLVLRVLRTSNIGSRLFSYFYPPSSSAHGSTVDSARRGCNLGCEQYFIEIRSWAESGSGGAGCLVAFSSLRNRMNTETRRRRGWVVKERWQSIHVWFKTKLFIPNTFAALNNRVARYNRPLKNCEENFFWFHEIVSFEWISFKTTLAPWCRASNRNKLRTENRSEPHGLNQVRQCFCQSVSAHRSTFWM